MKHEIAHYEHNEAHSRSVQISIDGRTLVTVSQVLRSPVDFKPCLPEINWSAIGSVDAHFAESMAIALKQASELCREWQDEMLKLAA